MPPFVSNDVVGLNDRGLIQGFADRLGIPNPLWRIRNVGGGGNEMIIENVFAPGNFASAEQLPNAELFGSPDQWVWTLVRQDRGYYLQSPNARLVWQLTRDGDDAPIVLIPFTGQDDTQWTFDRIGN
ncbi:hypothetical protein L210DRAFT_3630665 [Boletus edulis BED1]|uniref:Ricin B lectin domain-containing protein n=1 Tax=Boletus edulis BED1 TaxID=1328754 RepID=A0AAD4BUC2_BOLED|nr:hypothetical protein L210DRAFT_3630665 [Boletus edulis BED1]